MCNTKILTESYDIYIYLLSPHNYERKCFPTFPIIYTNQTTFFSHIVFAKKEKE